LSKHPRFGAPSNYAKSNHLGAPLVPNLYLFGTFSTKKRWNCPFDGEPVFARANPQAGRRRPEKPAQMSLGISSPEISPAWPAGAKDREDGYLAPTNVTYGHFRPKKRHSTRNPAETFQPMNDLAARPDPVM
jgi:hypothetical protein